MSMSLLLTLGAAAQTESFDLSSQRKEVRDVNPVPGRVLEHRLVINPTVQNMVIDESETLDVTRGFRLKDKTGAMGNAASFLKKGKIKVHSLYRTQI